MRGPFIAIAVLATAGCLEPLVSDEPGASVHILPAGTQVPHVSSHPDLERQIRVNDGLSDSTLEMAGGVVMLKKGWAEGAKVSYWDFGDVQDRGALLYVLVQRDGETLTPIDHPYVADTIPGDPTYSPFWFVQHVVVTSKYDGEVLASAQAIADAIDLGLVEEPVPAMLYVDGPIVPYGTKLDLGMGVAPGETMRVFAHGYVVDMLAIATPDGSIWRAMTKPGKVPRGDAHRIKEANAINPIKEPTFQNLSGPWTPEARIIDCRVTMPEDPLDPSADISDESMLFLRDDMGTMTMQTDRVIEWKISTSFKNWPILVTEAQ
jgi:hypothetical protein